MHPIPRFYRFISCFIAGTSCAFCLTRIGHRFLAVWLSMPALQIIAAGVFLAGLGYGVYWAFSRPDPAADTGKLALFQGIVRYMIAIDLIMIAIQGFLQFLFFVPLAALDFPFSSLSGEQLTWAYFGHYSRGFVYFVGSLQILGSILLLFRRTCLLGIFVLMPVIFAIVAINYFFDMERAESIQAIEIFISLLFLLFAERRRWWRLFFIETPIPAIISLTPALKNLFRASALLIPIFLLWRFGPADQNPSLTGKYKVSQLLIDNKVTSPGDCSDSVLTCIYLDAGNECVFEFNGPQRRWIGKYSLSEHDNKISVVWHYPLPVPDTLTGVLRRSETDNRLLSIDGRMGKENVEINVIKNK